jgi:hypothetical protein
MISGAERILNRVSCPIADVTDEYAADFANVPMKIGFTVGLALAEPMPHMESCLLLSINC